MITVKTTLIDSTTRKPLPDVNAYVSDTAGNPIAHNGVANVGRVSGKNGSVILPVAVNADSVTFSYVGYKKLTMPATAAQKRKTIIMMRDVEALPEVNILPSKKETPKTDGLFSKIKSNKWLMIAGAVALLIFLGVIFYALKSKK